MPSKKERAVLVVHGGAGTLKPENVKPGLERRYCLALARALKAGYSKLEEGRSSLAAVEAAVKVMENSPLFNAGKGAVFTEDGHIELDAAIMDGATHEAGAVSGINCVKNPIAAARAVMEHSPHVLLIGEGANKFLLQVAPIAKLRVVDEEYFWTQARWDALQRHLKLLRKPQAGTEFEGRKFGTVGAVAVDGDGNLAAATSTGGMTGKKFGRTGDSPIIGAGTYADNATCAVSCTGYGEFFMRNVSAYDVAALMKYAHLGIAAAADRVIHKTLAQSHGEGGLIAIDAKGNIAMPFNSAGMLRGYITADGDIRIGIFRT